MRSFYPLAQVLNIPMNKWLESKQVKKLIQFFNNPYFQLMRINRPIGILLLLWPTLTALWIAADGVPPLKILTVFILGVILMRSAGCVINDWADRDFDGKVRRTENRPLVTGIIPSRHALLVFIALAIFAFSLVLLLNRETIMLSVGGLILAFIYPFMKRYTYYPQVVLGAAFSWGIVMAFMAVNKTIPDEAWLLFIANILWTMVYDTQYAMVDREDDLKIGIKSTAILFAEADKFIIGMLQILVVFSLILVAMKAQLHWSFYLGLGIVSALFYYQQKLIKRRQPEACFKAFLNNNWVGLVMFTSVVLAQLF